MPIRRHCNPINVKRLWNAIRCTNVARQACDLTKIYKYLQAGGNCTLQQVELYLKQCIKDGLIVPSKKSGIDCNYRITDQELPTFDDKDWYCFECHLAGEVNECVNCFRVFHSDCIKSAKKKFSAHKISTMLLSERPTASSSDLSVNSSELNFDMLPISSADGKSDYTFDDKLCSVCNIVNIDDCKLEKAEMNYLLKFVLHRIRNWLPNTITHTMAAEDRPSWLTDSELTWRANQLFFEHRDMSVIEVNLNSESYSILSEFLADILTVQHNVAIFHGIESQEYQAAEYMVRDTLHDITELRNCSDCYKHSNEKVNTRWFALPCREPHMLVWAKQKGYSYWPAKVISESASHLDVRFFGGKHERSVISKSFIKPISVSRESLKIKPSSAFTKALEELIYHQKLLSNPQEVEKVMADAKVKRPIKKNLPTVISPPILAKPVDVQPMDTVLDDVANIRKRKSSIAESTEPTLNKVTKVDPEKKSKERISANVIQISDCEDEEADYSFRKHASQEATGTDENYGQVSSSTEKYRRVTEETGLHELDQPYSDSVEKMRWKAEMLTDKSEIIKCAMECMQAEIDRLIDDRNEHLKRLFESHNSQISETKKKQWCYNCEQDAIYHCCWNTAYCSQTCQQQHWQTEHKKVCRRKRQT